MRIFLVSALTLALAACDSATEREEPLSTGDGRMALYDCPTGDIVEAHFLDEEVQFAWRGTAVRLPQVEAASGARYAKDRTEFWEHGDKLALRLPDTDLMTCTRRTDAVPRNPDMNPTNPPQ